MPPGRLARRDRALSYWFERNFPTLFFFRRKAKTTTPGQDESAAPAQTTASAATATADPIPLAASTAEQSESAAEGPSRRRRSRRGRKPGQGAAATVPALELPGADLPLPPAFAALGIDETGLRAIAALGYETPTPIQAEALPVLLAGDDVVGMAQTGTGKTIAFGLPLARSVDPGVNAIQALVLVPTRELATQVRDVLDLLGRYYGFAVVGLMGGRALRSDFAALEKGAHVIVGTPGRVIDHLRRGTFDARGVHFVVLDEADQMLDIGFARDIDYILRHVPRERQTCLFSATMPESIRRLVYRYLRKAVNIAVAPEQLTAEGVVQYYCEVAERDKLNALRYLYENMDFGRSLIFRRTKIGVDRLTEQLQAAGVPARAIHGDLRQGERDRVMNDFRSGALEFLVATNVASRGLDIPDIQHVINYDVPQNAEEYIHRIGRTARAGKTGAAITLVGEWELNEWDVIANTMGSEDLQRLAVPARYPAGQGSTRGRPRAAAVEEPAAGG